MAKLIAFSIINMFLYCLLSNADNILFQSVYGEGSHFFTTAAVANAATRAGHNVTFIVSSAYGHRSRDPNYRHFNFQIFDQSASTNLIDEILTNATQVTLEEGISLAALHLFQKFLTIAAEDCDAILGDAEFMERLKRQNFSAMVFDITWPCSLLISRKLRVKQIVVFPPCFQPSIAMFLGAEINLAYVPAGKISPPSPPLSFTQRFKNVFHLAIDSIVRRGHYSGYADLQSKHEIDPDVGMIQLMSEVDLALFNIDFVLEYPVPLPPNIIPVGGLTTRPSQPVPQDFEDFMQSSGDDGVLLFSLGTYLKQTNRRIDALLADTFSKLPYKVLWKHANAEELPTLPNVKVEPWLPLNDLLGHEKTRAIVYQGGNNGLYEAIYHGVPMVVLPITADQDQIATKVTYRGIGVTVEIRTVTSDELADVITEVITNDTYRKTIKKMSQMFRQRPMTPSETAAYWVDHVIKFGGKQYRPLPLEVNYLQRSLLDVVATLIFLGILTIYLVVLIIKFFFRLCVKAFNVILMKA